MYRNFSFIVLVLLLGAACRPNADKNKTTTEVNNIYQRDSLIIPTENPLLVDFKQFLSELDSSNVSNISLAFEYFTKQFEGQRAGLCDSGFVYLQQMIDTVELVLNVQLYEDTINYSPLMGNVKVPAQLSRYKTNLENNGFKISFSEGMPYVEQDRKAIIDKFGQYLTEPMQAYLEHLRLENQEGFSEDACITITPAQYVERLVWYEEFFTNNKEFVFIDNCKKYYKAYLTYLFAGMDNTPLYDDVEQVQLSDYYINIHKYLSKKYPNSKALSLLQPYYQAIQQRKKDEAHEIYRKNVISGNIYNLLN